MSPSPHSILRLSFAITYFYAAPTHHAATTSTDTATVVVDEDQHSLDPTRADADRLCRDSHVRGLLGQQLAMMKVSMNSFLFSVSCFINADSCSVVVDMLAVH